MDQQTTLENYQKVFEILVTQDDVGWKSLIFDLIRNNEMDPWDVDVSKLSQMYTKTLKELKEHDFRVSGKVILCAALLLKVKSDKLVEGDIAALDQLIVSSKEAMQDEYFEDDLGLIDEDVPSRVVNLDEMQLVPKTPQPRKRKISVFDLVDALEKALEVKRRRVLKRVPTEELTLPNDEDDISIRIRKMMIKIKQFFLYSPGKKLTFQDLTPTEKKMDKVKTFIPLLHLSNHRKVDLIQQEHFGEIMVYLNAERSVEKEIEAEA